VDIWFQLPLVFFSFQIVPSLAAAYTLEAELPQMLWMLADVLRK